MGNNLRKFLVVAAVGWALKRLKPGEEGRSELATAQLRIIEGWRPNLKYEGQSMQDAQNRKG